MIKRILAIALVLVMASGFGGCAEKYKLPEYSKKEFEISGAWAPYELNEETLTQYKNAGFNTLSFSNHSLEWTSENQYYLGSERTMKALELCKKMGLKANISHNGWVAEGVEGEDYFSSTPFSKYDLYEEYKDIITGVSISDEPNKEKLVEIADKTMIDDFKKVYPNAHYGVNFIPITANSQGWGYTTYQEMLDMYSELIMSQFEKPYISLDLYPFHIQAPDTDLYLAANYEMIAKLAKKHSAKTSFYIQSSTGTEFEDTLSEGDIRWQVNSVIAYGADAFVYYLYSVPLDSTKESGYMYNHCILNPDNTPSKIYPYVQKVNKEAQALASVVLSYDWDAVKGIEGSKESAYRASGVAFNEFENAKHFVKATATHDLIVSRFTSETYGEAYMLTNFADRGGNNKINVKFKDCRAVAVYGGKGYSGTPEIVELEKDGKFTRELPYGDGIFVTPLI